MIAALADVQPNAVTKYSAIILLWIILGTIICTLMWPRGRRLARQTYAVAILGVQEGIRLKVLWTVALLSMLPGILAYWSDADGTHAGRARLIIDTCFSTGEILGATLIVLLSALSVAREIESRIMHTFGTKPIPRWGILLGKTLGFWFVDLAFLAGLALFTGLLVRLVPLRAEVRAGGTQVVSGTWDQLRRNTLTTRHFRNADGEPELDKATYKFIEPGKSFSWNFAVDPREAQGDPFSLKLLLSSTETFASRIEGVRVVAGMEGQPALLDREMTILAERPLELFIEPRELSMGTLTVTVFAGKTGKYPPSIVAQRPRAVQIGVTGDSFEANMLKSFLVMAIQGWILALITTSWSGTLSFAVTVALGVILVLGGEMSREALTLLQRGEERARTLGLVGADAPDRSVLVQYVLQILPDFRAAGAPAGFVEGTYLSGWAIANAALWMGVVRGVGWALPGFVFFQLREVGK